MMTMLRVYWLIPDIKEVIFLGIPFLVVWLLQPKKKN